MTEEAAERYLQRILARLSDLPKAATLEIQRGDPLTVIVQSAERVQADLIVLATHARSSLDAFWAGSLTPRLAARSRTPLLLVPIPKSGPQSE